MIDKAYYTLAELSKIWSLDTEDFIYLAERQDLTFCVKVNEVLAAIYCQKEKNGLPYGEPIDKKYISGLFDLHPRQACEILQNDSISLFRLKSSETEYVDLIAYHRFLRKDLLVRSAEKERFETHGLATFLRVPALHIQRLETGKFRVTTKAHEFELNDKQVQVLMILQTAANSGHPWCCGKQLLKNISQSTKMADLFKRIPNWHALIESNYQGYYRLKA